ncbi:MAG: DUF4350 domain-containing protein [Sandaracinaceae bacterium]
MLRHGSHFAPTARYAWGALVLFLAAGAPTPSAAQDDFGFDAAAWNGASELRAIAETRHSGVQLPDRLDVGTLGPNDSVLILHPQDSLPGSGLTGFLRAGGRVALADDYGEGTSLLNVFQIGRGDPSTEVAMRLRGNPELLVARPTGSHRLSDGVRALVSNHPQMVYHRELSPIFELNPGEALVLAGAVGDGRLVVLSDPSVLINNMLSMRGNRRFAENLIDYLEDERGGRLFLVGPETRVVGRYGEPGADRPLHSLRRALETVTHLDIPPLALQVLALSLAALATLFAFGSLPRRSPYRSTRMFARAPAQGGFVGRVGYFARRKANLLAPLLVYKFELEAAVLRELGLSRRALLREVLDTMRKRGIGEADVGAMRAMMLELDELREKADRPPSPPHISERRFRSMVAAGDRLLGLLEKQG